MKKCSKCGIEKDKLVHGKSCAECMAKYRREYQQKNKEYLKTKNAERYIKNKKRHNAATKQYHLLHREEILKQRREYREKNKIEINKKALKRYYNNYELSREKAHENYLRNKKWHEEYRKQNAAKIAARMKDYRKSYRTENRAKIINKQRECVEKRKEHYRNMNKRNLAKGVQQLDRRYLNDRLKDQGFTKEQIELMPALLDIKKISILKHRIQKLLKTKNDD